MENINSQLTDLIVYIDGVRQQMDGLISDTDPNLEICPGWRTKEIIGHISAWEIVIHKAIQAFSAGEPPYFLREQDFDRFNQSTVDLRADWTMDRVLQEWKTVRAELRELIKTLDPALLDEELVLPWGSERTLAELIEILGEHETEHLENIIKVTE